MPFPDIVSPGRVTRENQHVFIGTAEIPGVQSIRADYEANASPLRLLGSRTTLNVPRGAQGGSVSINTLLISDDLLAPLTGDYGVNGYIVRDRDEFAPNTIAFTSGYLTSYSVRYGIGQLPEISTQIAVLGTIGEIPFSQYSAEMITDSAVIRLNTPTSVLKIPGPGSITLNLGDNTTNRVTSYELNLKVNRNPSYMLGASVPYRVDTDWPIEALCSYRIELDNYQMQTSRAWLSSPKMHNLNISVKTANLQTNIATYSIPNMLLYSEAYDSTVEGMVTLTAQYRGLIHR